MHHKALQVAVLILSAAVGLHPAAPSKIGKLQPVDEKGFDHLVKSGKGRVVLVNFWATWCAPCREEMPALAKLESALRARGFTLVTVSADEPEQEANALAFLERNGVRGPAYIKRPLKDEDFINAIDRKWVGALPASFLFDRSGRKAQSFIGEVPMADLESAIRKLL